MPDRDESDPTSESIELALRREAVLASGRSDAIKFAWDCRGDPGRLEEEIEDTVELLRDPRYADTTMKPNTSTRLYREAYLAGLRTAHDIIQAAITGSAPPSGD